MGLTLITPATATVVALEEVKRHTRQLDNGFDDLFSDHLVTAQVQVEKLLGRCLVPQTWRLTLDKFSDAIKLPVGPATSVTVKYFDTAGALQTASPSLYTLDLTSDPQWVVLNSGAVWPETLDGVNAVQIYITAGFTYTSHPTWQAARSAIRALVVSWFEVGTAGIVPDHVRALLFPHTAHGF